MLTACAQQDAKFPASALPWHPGQQLSLVTIPGRPCLLLASPKAQHTGALFGAQHAGMSHRVQDMGVTWGSAYPGTTQGSSHWPCCDAGLRASPGGLCLLSEVLLTFRLCQVFGLVCMALSGFPLPLLAVCCLPWEKTSSQICSPLFCFNSFLVGGHDSLLATQPCPSPSRTKGPKNNITG